MKGLVIFISNVTVRKEEKSKSVTPRIAKCGMFDNDELVSYYEKKEIKEFIESSWKTLTSLEESQKKLKLITSKQDKDPAYKRVSNTRDLVVKDEETKSSKPVKVLESKSTQESVKGKSQNTVMIAQYLKRLEEKKIQARESFNAETDMINAKLENIAKRLNNAAVISEKKNFAKVLSATVMIKPQERVAETITNRNKETKRDREIRYIKKAQLIKDHNERREKILKDLQDKVTKDIGKKKQIQEKNYNRIETERIEAQKLLAHSFIVQSNSQV